MNAPDPKKDKDLIDKLQIDIKRWPEVVERNKKFGIFINPDSNILKRRLYSKFVLLSKAPETDIEKKDNRELSMVALEWMADFAKNGPFDDIRQHLNNHTWVKRYQELKGIALQEMKAEKYQKLKAQNE
jgi:hypothetical protein